MQSAPIKPPGDPMVQQMNHNIVQYYVESWIRSISDVTIPTTTLQLTLPQLQLIQSIFHIIYHQYFVQLKKIQKEELSQIPFGKTNWMTLPCIAHLAQGDTFVGLLKKCEEIMAPNKKYFVKLSLRSAKDSLCLKKYEFMIQEDLKEKYPHNYKEESYRLALVVRDALSALEQLTTSQRIADDIDLHLKLDNPESLKIHFRPWVIIPHSLEFRIFIHERELTAISSYYKQELYPFLSQYKTLIQQAIVQFFNTHLKTQLIIPSAVMDIGFVLDTQKQVLEQVDIRRSLDDRKYEIKTIEVNPFGKASGGALFSWQEKVLETGPLQFRLSHQEHFL